MAQPSPTTVPYNDPIQQEVTSILGSLKHDLSLMGVISLGKDGVLRSLTADRDVVDAIGLNPKQIVSRSGAKSSEALYPRTYTFSSAQIASHQMLVYPNIVEMERRVYSSSEVIFDLTFSVS